MARSKEKDVCVRQAAHSSVQLQVRWISWERYCIRLPGFGATTSNTSNISFVHPGHSNAGGGTSHMKAVPLRNTAFEGRMMPSLSLKVVSEIESTMIAGRSASSRMLRKLRGRVTSERWMT